MVYPPLPTRQKEAPPGSSGCGFFFARNNVYWEVRCRALVINPSTMFLVTFTPTVLISGSFRFDSRITASGVCVLSEDRGPVPPIPGTGPRRRPCLLWAAITCYRVFGAAGGPSLLPDVGFFGCGLAWEE
jgi:hypothetical protein